MSMNLVLAIKKIGVLYILLMAWNISLAQQAQYDEAKVPTYVLPDPLILQNGKNVSSTKVWNDTRRKEILALFEDNVYGANPVGRPAEMTWKVSAENRHARHDSAITKNVIVYFNGKSDGPKMNLTITLPSGKRKVPVFLMPGWNHDPHALLPAGYGLVSLTPWEIEPDKKDTAYAVSVRKSFAPPGTAYIPTGAWGAMGVWAWALSRAMDYIETDADIDAGKVAILGFSRYGKVVMWAGAQDQRFAIVIGNEAGCGGAVIVRRGYGETLRSMNGYAPHWFNNKFKTYNDRVNDLPVDWHMLIALIAPRPVYIATAEDDRWGDPKGSFLAAQNAEPVYALFKKQGLGVTLMPALETPVGDFIGYHNRKGKHGLLDYDWAQFIRFADLHLRK